MHTIRKRAERNKLGLAQLHRKTSSIDKYEFLSHLRNDNVHLFYRLVMDHTKELTPLIYTPVVGEACLKWSEIYSRPEGRVFWLVADRADFERFVSLMGGSRITSFRSPELAAAQGRNDSCDRWLSNPRSR
jgi:hypothetical protein